MKSRLIRLELEMLSSIFVIAAITKQWLIYMKVYAAKY